MCRNTVLHPFRFWRSTNAKILIAKWTKAFGEWYVISKTKVKRNLLVVVIDFTLQKCTWSNSERNQKKGVPKNNLNIILTKE